MKKSNLVSLRGFWAVRSLIMISFYSTLFKEKFVVNQQGYPAECNVFINLTANIRQVKVTDEIAKLAANPSRMQKQYTNQHPTMSQKPPRAAAKFGDGRWRRCHEACGFGG